jgi:hypothetical protein
MSKNERKFAKINLFSGNLKMVSRILDLLENPG